MTTSAKLTLATLVSLLSAGLQAADGAVPTTVINDASSTTVIGVAPAQPQAPATTPQAPPAPVVAAPAAIQAPAAPAAAAPAPAMAQAPVEPQSPPVAPPAPANNMAPWANKNMHPRAMMQQMMPFQNQPENSNEERDDSRMQMPNRAQWQPMHRQSRNQSGPRGRGPLPRLMGQLSQLDLTDAQHESIRKKMEDQELARSAQQEAMQAERDKLRHLYRQDRPDAKAIGAIYDSIFAMRRARIEATINMRNSIMDELTEAQSAQLKSGPWGRRKQQ